MSTSYFRTKEEILKKIVNHYNLLVISASLHVIFKNISRAFYFIFEPYNKYFLLSPGNFLSFRCFKTGGDTQRLTLTKGVFTWHWPGRFSHGASSLRFPLMALYLVTWYHHKMSFRRESLRLEFYPVRNLATVSCKCKTTTRFGVKLVCR